ncbi:MAG: hypothetical protein ACRDTH_14630 [Pseudonocardiaceae bacterium]
MRFPNPVAVTCLDCGQPTVVAETSIGALRVHCGTWRWQCEGHAVPPACLTIEDAARDQELAA